MKREQSFKQLQCEKGLIWKGRQRLPFMYMWDGKIANDVAEGKEKTDVGEHPARQCHSPVYWVTNLELHFSLFRRQALATSLPNSKNWCCLKSTDLVNNCSNSSHLPFAGRCPWFISVSLVTPEELLLWLNSRLPFRITAEIPTLCVWVIVGKTSGRVL